MTRLGELGLPKRDGVVQPLLHTHSSEAGYLERSWWTSLGEGPWLKRECCEFYVCVCFMSWFVYSFLNIGSYMHVFVVFGLEGLSP